MARRQQHHLQQEILSARMQAVQRYALAALVLVLSLGGFYLLWRLPLAHTPLFWVGNLLLLVLPVGSVAVFCRTRKQTARRIAVLEAGLAGERAAQAVFERLPKAYTTVSDLSVTAEGKTSQLDHVVVGPTGVFVVETKNLRGIIRGTGRQNNWLHKKRGAETFTTQFYNPQKQVGTHVYRLNSYLREQGIRVYVRGAVYFSNPGAELQLRSLDGDIPVFAKARGGDRAMLRFLRREGKVKLGREQRERIVHLLRESR